MSNELLLCVGTLIVHILVLAERILQMLSRSKERVSDRLTTNLVYTDSIILDPSAGTPCPNKTYTLNGCFDPDFSLGGTQPTYWDQLSLIYSRYKVKGSKMTAIFSRSTTVLGT